MRVRSHWFRETGPKPPEAIAHAAAVTAWRLARAALGNMRAADFELAAGRRYFGFLAEFLAFLVAIADRVAYEHLDETARLAFTQAFAEKLSELHEENETELLGSGSRSAFIERCNTRGETYAECGWAEGRPSFPFLRCLASFLGEHLPERDQPWVHDQVMEIEGPQAAETLRQAILDLLGLAPTSRRGAAQAMGD
ncbi:MAG: hypothetical protein HYZ17_14820 [Betaproteobacteria bacterium]|nr:hypothetical protein [Betaproteobacteria bacterium]